ncbi:MAG: hypothetical protein IPK74_05355 [Deltaproteobacteria bacterium]|nr:hypothetical protein [Deltaproteobacteria bacterium]
MLTHTRRFASTLPLLAVIACGSDDDREQVDMRDAQIGWTATNEAAAAGHGAFTSQVPAGQEGEIVVACSGGGEMRIVGTSNAEDDVQLDTSFDACVDDDVIINGDLALVVSLDVDVDVDDDGADDDHIAAGIVMDYDGSLQLDGRVEGSCIVDAELRAKAVVFENFAALGVATSGTICGHEADLVIRGEADDVDDA